MSENSLHGILTKEKREDIVFMVIGMLCFPFDLNHTIKISLFGKEHLIPPRSHIARNTPCYILYFVIQGVLTLSVNHKEVQLVPGDVYIFPQNDLQEPRELTDVSYYYVHFQWEDEALNLEDEQYTQAVKSKNVAYAKANNHGLSGYDELYVLVKQKTHIDNRKCAEQLCTWFERCTNLFWSKNPENRYWISANFARILSKLENVGIGNIPVQTCLNPGIYSTVMAVSNYLSHNFAKEIGRKEIEDRFAVNYDYLNRNFHSLMGKSIVRYRNTLRIERAKLLLATTEKGIAEIAEETGFIDKYYFVRLFKKIAGISPAEYKKVAYEKDI